MHQGDGFDRRQPCISIAISQTFILLAGKIGKLIKFLRALPMEKDCGSLFYAEIARTRQTIEHRMPYAPHLIEANKECGRLIAFTKLNHKAAVIGCNT